MEKNRRLAEYYRYIAKQLECPHNEWKIVFQNGFYCDAEFKRCERCGHEWDNKLT